MASDKHTRSYTKGLSIDNLHQPIISNRRQNETSGVPKSKDLMHRQGWNFWFELHLIDLLCLSPAIHLWRNSARIRQTSASKLFSSTLHRHKQLLPALMTRRNNHPISIPVSASVKEYSQSNLRFSFFDKPPQLQLVFTPKVVFLDSSVLSATSAPTSRSSRSRV